MPVLHALCVYYPRLLWMDMNEAIRAAGYVSKRKSRYLFHFSMGVIVYSPF